MNAEREQAGIVRGEIWQVQFSPSIGDEIRKTRPAVVINVPGAGRMMLRLVVPVTEWQPRYRRYFWMVHLTPDAQNGLTKESAADAFQTKSMSLLRFERRLGVLNPDKVNEIAAAIALCAGYHT